MRFSKNYNSLKFYQILSLNIFDHPKHPLTKHQTTFHQKPPILQNFHSASSGQPDTLRSAHCIGTQISLDARVPHIIQINAHLRVADLLEEGFRTLIHPRQYVLAAEVHYSIPLGVCVYTRSSHKFRERVVCLGPRRGVTHLPNVNVSARYILAGFLIWQRVCACAFFFRVRGRKLVWV